MPNVYEMEAPASVRYFVNRFITGDDPCQFSILKRTLVTDCSWPVRVHHALESMHRCQLVQHPFDDGAHLLRDDSIAFRSQVHLVRLEVVWRQSVDLVDGRDA